MASFDYDVVIIGSGFGGSIAFAWRGEELLPGWHLGGRQTFWKPGTRRLAHTCHALTIRRDRQDDRFLEHEDTWPKQSLPPVSSLSFADIQTVAG